MAFMIYLIGMLEGLNIFFGISSCLLGIFWGISLLFTQVLMPADNCSPTPALLSLQKWAFVLLIVCGTGAWLVPTPKTVIAMYVIPKIVHNEQISHLSELGIKSTVKYLTTYLESQNSKQ